MITNINKGICQWRATNNQPSFFVNWQVDGQQQYRFFSIVSSMYNLYNRLKTAAKEN
jgi:hypothetical protein